MSFYHLPYHARAVGSLTEIIVSLVLQLLPVKVFLRKGCQPSHPGVGSMGDGDDKIIDLKHKVGLDLGGVLSSGDLYCVM